MRYTVKIILAFLGIAFIAMQACKKSNSSPTSSGYALMNKIISKNNGFFANTYDTALISYNTDSTVHQMMNSLNNDGTVTFYYSQGLIKKVTSFTGGWETTIDSIILNANGLAQASYELLNSQPSDNTTQYYSYSASGELARIIFLYPNRPTYPIDTVTYTWANGDMMSQISTSHERDFTYTYDAQKQCQPGDPIYLLHFTETGLTTLPNSHLCTSLDAGGGPATYTYGYDANNRITQFIVTQDQKSDTSYFQY